MSHPSSTKQKQQQAYFYLLLTTSIWGSLFVVARLTMQTIPPMTLLCMRYVCAFFTLFAIFRLQKKTALSTVKIEKTDYKYLAFIAVVGYFLGVGAQLIGTKYAGASVASLVNAMNPISISIFAVWILKEKLTVHKIIAVIASVSGACIILQRAEPGDADIGVIFSIVSVILWSFSSIVVRRMTQKYAPLMITTFAIGIAALCTIPASIIELHSFAHVEEMFRPVNVLNVLYLAVICTALPQWLWNKSLSLVEASTCSLFYPVQPLVSVLLGIAILGERIDLQFLLGAFCIIGGILYAVLSERKKVEKYAPAEMNT